MKVPDVIENALWLAVEITGNQKDMTVLKDFASLENVFKDQSLFSLENPLPKTAISLSDVTLPMSIDPVVLLLKALNKCLQFIKSLIQPLQKRFSDIENDVRLDTNYHELTELYELGLYLEREIGTRFVSISRLRENLFE